MSDDDGPRRSKLYEDTLAQILADDAVQQLPPPVSDDVRQTAGYVAGALCDLVECNPTLGWLDDADYEALPGVLEARADEPMPGYVTLIVAPGHERIDEDIADEVPIGTCVLVVCPRSGAEWAREVRGSTVWLPALAMRNADGTLRASWFPTVTS